MCVAVWFESVKGGDWQQLGRSLAASAAPVDEGEGRTRGRAFGREGGDNDDENNPCHLSTTSFKPYNISAQISPFYHTFQELVAFGHSCVSVIAGGSRAVIRDAKQCWWVRVRPLLALIN